MLRRIRGLIALTALVVLGISTVATHVSAFTLRVPQVVINGASLQGYINSKDGGINVQTDQLDAQIWSTSATGNSVFTLMLEMAGNAASNNIGVYNYNDPAPVLFQVFPGAASAGWHATISFLSAPDRLVVTLFDQNAVIMGQTTYLGVDKNAFGFYIQGPGGTFFSQDSRNPGLQAQVLTYAGTGLNFGEWWLCFEDLPLASSDRDFDDAVVVLESVGPLKTNQATLGWVKALYR